MVISSKLQNFLDQLSDLTLAELGEVKAAVHAEQQRQLITLGIHGDLTEEEWEILEVGNILSCVKMVRDRTGLDLVGSRDYVNRARAKGRKLNAPTPRDNSEDSGDSEDSGAGP